MVVIHRLEHQRFPVETEDQLMMLVRERNPLIEEVDLVKREAVTGYFIGLQWLFQRQAALYVSPKLDSPGEKIDYLSLFADCLQQPSVLKGQSKLYHIASNEPLITLEKEKDILTPLVIFHFLKTTQDLVKKGLNNGYYSKERNLIGRIKGKILISENIKRNLLQSQVTRNYCRYETFTQDYPENRVIKKALLFVLKYLKSTRQSFSELKSLLDFVLPVFAGISDKVSLHEVSSTRVKSFHSVHQNAVDLGMKILQRFGMSIQSITNDQTTSVPPFWINMPLIFELYVLGKLQKILGHKNVEFQANGNYGFVDFLYTMEGRELVIDAKYKLSYIDEQYWIDDIRQLSAYARDKGILARTKIPREDWKDTLLKCLIIHPEQKGGREILTETWLNHSVPQFENFFKLGLSIPTKRIGGSEHADK